MDARAQLSRLSPQAREALARRIKTHLSDAENAAPDYDVTIVGGEWRPSRWRANFAAHVRGRGF